MMRRSEMGEDHPQVPMPVRGFKHGATAGAATFRGLQGEERLSIDLAGAFVLEYDDFTPLHPEGTDLDEAERRKGGFTKPILTHPRDDGLSLVVRRLLLCPSKRIIAEAFVTDEGGTVPLSGSRGIRSEKYPRSGQLQWIEIDPKRADPLVQRAIESVSPDWRGSRGESVADLRALWDAAVREDRHFLPLRERRWEQHLAAYLPGLPPHEQTALGLVVQQLRATGRPLTQKVLLQRDHGLQESTLKRVCAQAVKAKLLLTQGRCGYWLPFWSTTNSSTD
jgi:hypothetical protein